MHNDIIMFSLFPIVGVIMRFLKFNKKSLWTIAILSFVVLIPTFNTNVYLTNPWIDNTLLMLISACGYTIYAIDHLKKKGIVITYILPILASISIMIATGVYAFFTYFGGDNYVIKQCRTNNYRLDFIEARGFSGRPANYENLYREYLFSLYSYKLESIEGKTENSYLIDGKEIQFCK